jgi:hypothetical protein
MFAPLFSAPLWIIDLQNIGVFGSWVLRFGTRKQERLCRPRCYWYRELFVFQCMRYHFAAIRTRTKRMKSFGWHFSTYC